jgi:hypothetical protein
MNDFMRACYEINSISELKEALKGPADKTDMKEWGITSNEWYQAIDVALLLREKG